MKGAKSRLTIDIDSKDASWGLQAQKAYYELKRHAAEVDVRVSSSGEGIHLCAFFDERLTDAQKERWRRHLGDDARRIHLDTQRRSAGHMTQVLWTHKGNGEMDDDYDTLGDALSAIALG
jgi:hypothetical protein